MQSSSTRLAVNEGEQPSFRHALDRMSKRKSVRWGALGEDDGSKEGKFPNVKLELIAR
jgi:hypothetical protein